MSFVFLPNATAARRTISSSDSHLPHCSQGHTLHLALHGFPYPQVSASDSRNPWLLALNRSTTLTSTAAYCTATYGMSCRSGCKITGRRSAKWRCLHAGRGRCLGCWVLFLRLCLQLAVTDCQLCSASHSNRSACAFVASTISSGRPPTIRWRWCCFFPQPRQLPTTATTHKQLMSNVLNMCIPCHRQAAAGVQWHVAGA